MKKLLLFIVAFINMQSSLILTMDQPDGWKPTRGSSAGRPRPVGMYFPNQTATPATIQNTRRSTPGTFDNPLYVNPLYRGTDSATVLVNPTPVDTARIAQPEALGYAQNPSTINRLSQQIESSKPLPKIPHKPLPPTPHAPSAPSSSAQTTSGVSSKQNTNQQLGDVTPSEREHLDKIERDLDEITDKLIELGWAMAPAGISLISLNPAGAVATLSSPDVGLRVVKIGILLGNIAKHTISLSHASAAARTELKEMLPRLTVISHGLVKAPEKLQSAARKVIDIIKKIVN